MDCGPTCLRMIVRYYGRSLSLNFLRNKTKYGREGVSMLGLAEAAESIGLKTIRARLTYEQLIRDAPLPAIIHWDQAHFVVLYNIKKQFLVSLFYSRRRIEQKTLMIADPGAGLIKLSKEEFLKRWIPTPEYNEGKGIALLLEPTLLFKVTDFSGKEYLEKTKIGKQYILGYLKKNKTYLFQILLGLLISSLLQLVFPYLTQSIVDVGIKTQNITFIQIVLAAQVMLLFSQTVIEFIRAQILLHISTRINISLLSGFWAKILKLPLQFFDTKHPGDIIQRIEDYHRIENFLTGAALNTIFSLFTFAIFSFVLFNYNTSIFIIFLIGSILYLFWIRFFLKYRRQLDYKHFRVASKESNATMQLVYGIQEIKLNNAENTYRWAWEVLQANLFRLNFKSLSLRQYQQLGAFLINQAKNIYITFFVANLVIQGKLSFGAMLAIQYIIGQLNSPIEQLISFTHQFQDAQMSIERLNDIHNLEDEEPIQKKFYHHLPEKHDIKIKDLCFTYPGAGNKPVLKNINLTIPQGKVTAIVGISGSGKTTLLKLLLQFYNNYQGDIYLSEINFRTFSPRYWRSISGSVMQNTFIFNDSIKNNIIMANESINEQWLINSCKTANILSFIESLPLGFDTKLGAEGADISGGQKQRLAIARAIYKNPQFIFFDEATNSLDAENEKVIIENLQRFFSGKTVIIVAHRLSTVKNADKIVVMENGEIAEEGTHDELARKKGKYYQLVKNQLELGN